MGLTYDDPQLAALTLTRIAAEEAPASPGNTAAQLLDLAEVEALEGFQ